MRWPLVAKMCACVQSLPHGSRRKRDKSMQREESREPRPRYLLPKAGIGYYPLQLVVYKLPVPGLARSATPSACLEHPVQLLLRVQAPRYVLARPDGEKRPSMRSTIGTLQAAHAADDGLRPDRRLGTTPAREIISAASSTRS